MGTGVIVLDAGALLMSMYLLRRAPYTDFSPAASFTVMWSFRLWGIIGVPLALWDVLRVVLPATGSSGEKIGQDWWLWLLLLSGLVGWFAGRAVGGLIAMLTIWISDRIILKQL